MSNISRVGRGETGVMEPLLSGGYYEHSYESNQYRCDGCGLVWAKRWYAETCESRGHASSFDQGPYGISHVENGKLIGNPVYYTRSAIRRERVARGGTR